MSGDREARSHNLRLTEETWAALESIAAREGLLYGGVPSRARAVEWLATQAGPGTLLRMQGELDEIRFEGDQLKPSPEGKIAEIRIILSAEGCRWAPGALPPKSSKEKLEAVVFFREKEAPLE